VIPKGLSFAVAGAALAAALWLAFRPMSTEAPAAAPVAASAVTGVVADARAASPQAATEARSTVEHTFQFALKKGRVASAPARLEVREGDRVILEIIADSGDELHLHGYDLRLQIVPDREARLAFVANRTGRFGLELHHAHAELGALEVYPR
jgi:hypothetical protein